MPFGIVAAAPAIAASGPAAPLVAAGLGVAAGLVALNKMTGKGRKAANKLNEQLHDPFKKRMEAIAELKKTDPAAAQVQMEKEWNSYLGQLDKFAAKGSEEANVVKQNLTNPKFTQTVGSLLGDKDPFSSSFTQPFMAKAGSSSGGGIGGSILGGLGKIFGSIIPQISTQTPGYNPNAPRPGAGGGTIPPPGGGGFPPSVPGGPTAPSVTPQDPSIPWTTTAVGAGTELLGAWLASRAANKAAGVQSDAATQAAELNARAGADALQFNRDVFDQNQRNIQPWLDAGGNALTSIQDMTANWPTAPKPEDIMKDPMVQFRLDRGRKILEASAARKGTLFGGAFEKDLDSYAQGVASDEYSKVFDRFQTERAAKLNPLLALAGLGQTAVGQSTNAGQNSANAGANIGQTTAFRVGDQMTDAAGARASGYVASGNAWNKALGQIGGNVMTIADLYRASRAA